MHDRALLQLLQGPVPKSKWVAPVEGPPENFTGGTQCVRESAGDLWPVPRKDCFERHSHLPLVDMTSHHPAHKACKPTAFHCGCVGAWGFMHLSSRARRISELFSSRACSKSDTPSFQSCRVAVLCHPPADDGSRDAPNGLNELVYPTLLTTQRRKTITGWLHAHR